MQMLLASAGSSSTDATACDARSGDAVHVMSPSALCSSSSSVSVSVKYR